jgi:hypothetical protein
MNQRKGSSAAAQRPTRRRKNQPDNTGETFWAKLIAIGNEIPEEELEKLPTDAAERFDEYLESGFFERAS